MWLGPAVPPAARLVRRLKFACLLGTENVERTMLRHRKHIGVCLHDCSRFLRQPPDPIPRPGQLQCGERDQTAKNMLSLAMSLQSGFAVDKIYGLYGFLSSCDLQMPAPD